MDLAKYDEEPCYQFLITMIDPSSCSHTDCCCRKFTVCSVIPNLLSCREKHPGSFDIIHIKDSQGHVFATRLGYVFSIGKVIVIMIGRLFT